MIINQAIVDGDQSVHLSSGLAQCFLRQLQCQHEHNDFSLLPAVAGLRQADRNAVIRELVIYASRSSVLSGTDRPPK